MAKDVMADATSAALARLQELLGPAADMSALAAPQDDDADETNELYRSTFNTPSGRAVLGDMIARLVVGGTYQPGGDPGAAVYDAGIRALIGEIVWRAQERD